MISSIDLFLSRDWADGAGPTVDCPRVAPDAVFAFPCVSTVAVLDCEGPDDAAGWPEPPKRFDADAAFGASAWLLGFAAPTELDGVSCPLLKLLKKLGAALLDGGPDLLASPVFPILPNILGAEAEEAGAEESEDLAVTPRLDNGFVA